MAGRSKVAKKRLNVIYGCSLKKPERFLGQVSMGQITFSNVKHFRKGLTYNLYQVIYQENWAMCYTLVLFNSQIDVLQPQIKKVK